MATNHTSEDLGRFFTELGGRVSERDDANRGRLQKFFGDLQFRVDLHRLYRKEAQRRLADDFNTFDWIQPTETTLSSILAELLRPAGLHGQGAIFLSLWVQMLAEKMEFDAESDSECKNSAAWWRDLAATESKLIMAKVVTESCTTQIDRNLRRMDIHIVFDEASLVIENKYGAPDQPEQIQDYVNHAREERPKFLVVYLSDGNEPTGVSIRPNAWFTLRKAGNALAISYRIHLIEWIEQCIRRTEADKVRWFLRDFRKFIERNPNLTMLTIGERNG